MCYTMSYYIIPDIEDDQMGMKLSLQGPYTNKDQVIDALALIGNSGVFDSKREALEYMEFD
jgi:hypothetical protein